MQVSSLQTNTQNRSTFFGRDILLGLEDVSVKFGTTTALDSINLSLTRGEVVFITGPSGAGKTTLLRLLAKEILPTKGKVLSLEDNLIFTSRIFQDLRLIPTESCLNNLKIAYDPQIYPSMQDFLIEMTDLCSLMGVTHQMKKKVSECNGGLKQKIAILRALLSRPDLLLADEATSSLDLDNAKKIFEVFHFYNLKRGTTIVWASHNRELLKYFTGRTIHLDNGRLVYSGHACFI